MKKHKNAVNPASTNQEEMSSIYQRDEDFSDRHSCNTSYNMNSREYDPTLELSPGKYSNYTSHDRTDTETVITGISTATQRCILSDSDTDHFPSKNNSNILYFSTPNHLRTRHKEQVLVSNCVQKNLLQKDKRRVNNYMLLDTMRQQLDYGNGLKDLVSLDMDNGWGHRDLGPQRSPLYPAHLHSSVYSDSGYYVHTSSSSDRTATGMSSHILPVEDSCYTEPGNLDSIGHSHHREIVEPSYLRTIDNSRYPRYQRNPRHHTPHSTTMDSDHTSFLHTAALCRRGVAGKIHPSRHRTIKRQLKKIGKYMHGQSQLNPQLQTLAIL